MEKTWKFFCLCIIASFLKLCNGFPIHFERTIIADPQIQLLSAVLAVVVTICTLLLIAGCLCCQRSSGFKEFRDSPVAISTVGSVDTGLVNPTADGAFTIFAPLSRENLSTSRERFRTDEDYIYGDINVTSWFNEGERDFPRAKLKYIREIGKGWFGRVVEGTAQDLEGANTWTPVVVRILESTAAARERVFFLHEAEIYRCGDHTNILKLYGRCLDSVPFLLLQEFCPQGDLKSTLLSNRPNAENLLSSEYPLIWCCQLTSAVKFLHEKGLAHSDLACRNCQLAANLTLKLGDYGLSTSRYPEDYYEGAISVRWCAPESIRHTSTTIRSERVTREANVWSLAVCFWEVLECAERPYVQLNDDEVVERVLTGGVRLIRPSREVLYTDYIYRLMKTCWLTPESRPTATQIYLTLTDLLQVFTVCRAENEAGSITDSQSSRESFDARWNSLKPNSLKASDSAAESSDKARSKPTSPSLNNLIGSLEDMNRSRNSDEYNAQSVLLPNPSGQKFEFKLGPQSKDPLETDSLNDSMIFTTQRSSSSETEEENWKTKIERGDYTEKVRQKSRSVTDLMVLTHIDCSESESETPLPSLDHRVNYKNVRLAPKHNLESASYVHGSEGNLLSVQDDFQAELRKLQEEHRDSLFFVPDKFSQNAKGQQINNNVEVDETKRLMDSPSETLFKELNSTTELKPAKQVYNVFNVTIDNISPVHVVKLNEIINLEEQLKECKVLPYEVPKLCDIIQNNSNVANLIVNSESESPEEVNKTFLLNERLNESYCQVNVENLTSSTCLKENLSSNGEMGCEVTNGEKDLAPTLNTGEKSEKFESQGVIQNVLSTYNSFDPDGRENVTVNENLKSVCNVTTNQKNSNGEVLNDAKLDLKQESINDDESELFEMNPEIPCIKNKERIVDVSKVVIEQIADDNRDSDWSKPDGCEIEFLENHQSVCDLESSKNSVVHQGLCGQINSFGKNASTDLSVERISNGDFVEDKGNILHKDSSDLRVMISPISNNLNNDVANVMKEVIVCEKFSNQNNMKTLSEKNIEKEYMNNNEIQGSESVQVILKEALEKSMSQREIPANEMTIQITVPDSLDENLPLNDSNDGREFSFKRNEESEDQCHTVITSLQENLANLGGFQDDNGIVFLREFLDEERRANEFGFVEKIREISNDSIVQINEVDVTNPNKISCQKRPEEFKTPNKKKIYQVPKLIEMIENNDRLMDYIIANYESELHDDLSCDNSCKINSPQSINVVLSKTKTEEANFDEAKSAQSYPIVDFDLSDTQESTNPNSLTHANTFANMRTKHKSLDFISSTPTKRACSSLRNVSDEEIEDVGLNYSLETWDNFLGRAIDSQNRSMSDQTFVFESLGVEPRSLIFVEGGDGRAPTATPPNSDTENSLGADGDGAVSLLDETYMTGEKGLNETYDAECLNLTFTADITEKQEGVPVNWESNGGWFLHPQSSTSVSGQLTEQKDNGSYVRFGMDDEILAALRGELLAKLPHAQGTSSDRVKENDDDWDSSEKDEVFLRYNVYNTPLSPIPEETDNEGDENSLCTTPGSPDSGASDDWPEKFLDGTFVAGNQDADSHSLRARGRHRHTPSQDSCCSNDTLFNLEDMACVEHREEGEGNAEESLAEVETKEDRLRAEAINYFKFGTALGAGLESPVADLESPMEQVPDKSYLMDFLVREREHSELVSVVVSEPICDLQSDSNSSKSVPLNRNVAPLPSPDDHPWKQLSASLLSLDRSHKNGLLDLDRKESDDSETQDSTYVYRDEDGCHDCERACTDEDFAKTESIYENVHLQVGNHEYDDVCVEKSDPCYVNLSSCENNPGYENVYVNEAGGENDPGYENVRVNEDCGGNGPDYENLRLKEGDDESEQNHTNLSENEDCEVADKGEATGNIYENIENLEDVLNEADYVNITNFENRKMDAEYSTADIDETSSPDYAMEDDDLVVREVGEEETEEDDAIFGVLTDIRFSGPGGEPHLMSTSFSESNNDERDWDSGSDTRSSSSGEFIWKEGEHEESLKALQALPQDLLDDIEPKEVTGVETSSESSCSDEEGECPEFIPSAWDKFATPAKSAMRSPEKTLEKEEKKKGVWFKKQRYHCVYEYPREPESPVLQSFDLWNNTPPATSYPDWYFDIDSGTDISEFTSSNFQDGDTLSTDFNSGFNNEFYITSSATPFDMLSGSTSQFFPGDHWSDSVKVTENSTPDSGVEDATPGSLERIDFAGIETLPVVVPSLKILAEAAHAKFKLSERENRSSEILGGLRHTRDKLKLDLPTSPSTFTANKTFNLEPATEQIVLRERPSFTTFGKSRFLVQHVDTPDKDPAGKNVCFEALPYKPPETRAIESRPKKIKKEEEKGEASLLDSADEDSGIESSTLERRSGNVTGKLIVDL